MSMVFIAVTELVDLSLIFGAILDFAAAGFRVEGNTIAEQINALPPQNE